MEKIKHELDRLIEATPSGEKRNLLTELNIILMLVENELKYENPRPLTEILQIR